ncbi:MAG: heavy metal translocating P-type ATPase [Chloroherpetonaceae bacterium]
MTCSNLNSPAERKNKPHAVTTCAHCGLPVYGKNLPDPAYCCCGCEMAATILKESPPSENALPPHLFRVILAFILSMFITLFSATIYQEQENAPMALSLASFVLTLVVFALLSKEFLRAMSQEFRKRSLSIATLVFVGTMAAFLISSWNFFRADFTHLYFETAAMALTLYVISLTIDAHFKLKLSHALSAWTSSERISVIKLLPNGQRWRTSAEEISIGDRFEVDAHSPLPVDAVLISGSGDADESHLTGEPLPVFKQAGDEVKAGAIWQSGTAQFQATSPYSDSSLNRYFKRVLELKAKQSSFERLAEKGASLLLGIALSVAAATFVYDLLNFSLDMALLNALSVLLISCPCGLAIATPIAFWLAIYRLEQAGVTVSGCGTAIEKLASIKTVLLDKTGTLTDGITIARITPALPLSDFEHQQYLSLAIALESEHDHPIAEAFRRHALEHDLSPASLLTTKILSGIGIEGTAILNGKSVSLALVNSRYCDSHHNIAHTLKPNQLGFFLNDDLKLIFTLEHEPKAQVPQAISALQSLGLKVAVLTGDSSPKPDFLSCDYHNALSPEQKASFVKQYETEFGASVFVGDGINDLEAMTTATTSIAMFQGANQAKTTADFTLFHPNLLMISEMISFARTAKRKVVLNLVWAISYNTIGIALAAFGFLTPLWAIAIMTASSAMVTLNSLSLLKANSSLSTLARATSTAPSELVAESLLN